jgi:hypothetical protein
VLGLEPQVPLGIESGLRPPPGLKYLVRIEPQSLLCAVFLVRAWIRGMVGHPGLISTGVSGRIL